MTRSSDAASTAEFAGQGQRLEPVWVSGGILWNVVTGETTSLTLPIGVARGHERQLMSGGSSATCGSQFSTMLRLQFWPWLGWQVSVHDS